MSTIATPSQTLLVGVPANSSERVLVNHPTQSATAIDGWKSVLFGLPFFAAGIFIEAVAFDYVGGKKHAPDWLIGLVGFFFFAAGAFLIIHGLRGVIRKTKYDREAAKSRANFGSATTTGIAKALPSPRSIPCCSVSSPRSSGTPS